MDHYGDIRTMEPTLKAELNLAHWTRLSITAVKSDAAKENACNDLDGEANPRLRKNDFRRIDSDVYSDMNESEVNLGDTKEKQKRKAGDVDFDDYMIVLDNYDFEMRKVEEEKAQR